MNTLLSLARRTPTLVTATLTIVVALLLSAPQGFARGAPDSFADLAERLSPAVVNISTSQTVDTPDRGAHPNVPPQFEDLFRDFFDRGRPRGPRRTQSLGSGFVITADGLVVTNNHVIEDADEIVVNFADGTSLPAELVGTDPKTDIALLKIEPEGPLPFVEFGSSTEARVGDWVLAIGNPFGLGGSVSAGIISARNRDINAGPYDDFIQTDAAINQGNSGGPLFNMDGEVIGVNTAIISPSGGSIGIGFSVPSDLARNVVAQLRDYGVTRRGWLGVRIQSVNDELAEALGMEKAQGALVADVTDAGPAQNGGIEAGDVIVKFDGKDVEEMRDLPRMVAETEVEKSVRVTVFRKGKTKTLKVTVGLLEEGDQAKVVPAKATGDVGSSETELGGLGLILRPLSSDARSEFEIGDDVNGVLVSKVEGTGIAAEKGVQAGDVIVEVGQEPVSSPAEVEARVRDAKEAGRKSVLFLIHSRGDLRFVPLSIED